MDESHSVTALEPVELSVTPEKIKCFALNYINHHLMLVTKQDILLYDANTRILIKKMAYAKKFEELYECEIKIKWVEPLIMSNMWACFVNKKSFLFFNEKLEFSKIYSPEANAALSILAIQRINEIITLREDRKLVKFWKYEIGEVDDSLRSDKEEPKPTSEYANLKKKTARQAIYDTKFDNFKKRMEMNRDEERSKFIQKKEQSFEITMQTRGNIQPKGNRHFMKLILCEELNLLIASFDTCEVGIYNLLTLELIDTKNFSNVQPDKDLMNNISTISVDQELLYYWDDKKFVIYDLLLNEEVCNFHHGVHHRVPFIHADRSNPNGGVYLVTTENKLLVYSHSSSKCHIEVI
jgi:hypothetical protein